MARTSSPPRGQATEKGRSFQFVREVYGELRKATWPSREQATRLTSLVLAISLAIGLALGVVDFIFSQLLRLVFF